MVLVIPTYVLRPFTTWQLSSLFLWVSLSFCVSLSFFFTHHGFTLICTFFIFTCLSLYFEFYFFPLIPPSLPHVRLACPSLLTVSCSRRNNLCQSPPCLFLFFVLQYSTPLNKLEIFKLYVFFFVFFFDNIDNDYLSYISIKTGSNRPLSLFAFVIFSCV